MNDAQKKALRKKLGAKGNKAFDARYSAANREWFVGKIIDALSSQGVADADMEARVSAVISGAGSLLRTMIKKGFSAPAGTSKFWMLYSSLTSRTQIIYGMIAMYPAFLDPANASYFDFVLERRFRCIQRMEFFVNPNSQRQIFGYPDESCPNSKGFMALNAPASAYWIGVLPESAVSPTFRTAPFILTSAGKSSPNAADDALFTAEPADCDRNLLFCDPLATTLHLDALFAAQNPDKLMQALISVGDHYLKIDSPLGHFANYDDGQRLLAVTSAPASSGSGVEIALGSIGRILLFSQTTLSPPYLAAHPDLLTTDADIQIDMTPFMVMLGDLNETVRIVGANPVTKKIKVDRLANDYAAGAKVYVVRVDPMKTAKLPYHLITDTRADHALFEQLSINSADLQVGDNIYVMNHPLYGHYYPAGAWGGEHAFIDEIDSRDITSTTFRNTLKAEGHGLDNTLLGLSTDMLSWINKILSILQAVTKIHLANLKANGRVPTGSVDFNTVQENGIDTNVFEYEMPFSYRDEDGNAVKSPGFVIKELHADASAFWLYNAKDSDKGAVPTLPANGARVVVAFIGDTWATQQFTPSKWAVRCFNAQTAKLETLPLFEKDDRTPKLLTFDSLAKSKPFFVTDATADVFVTRPRVDFSSSYQTFLKTNGAI